MVSLKPRSSFICRAANPTLTRSRNATMYSTNIKGMSRNVTFVSVVRPTSFSTILSMPHLPLFPGAVRERPETLADRRLPLTYLALHPVALQPPFDGVQKAECRPAVEDPVVEGDSEVHHAPYRYRIVHDHRPLHYSLGREYGRLRVVDDGDRDHGTESAGIVDREG